MFILLYIFSFRLKMNVRMTAKFLLFPLFFVLGLFYSIQKRLIYAFSLFFGYSYGLKVVTLVDEQLRILYLLVSLEVMYPYFIISDP